jgi:hypothetical protein
MSLVEDNKAIAGRWFAQFPGKTDDQLSELMLLALLQ